jgi:hypothetical protein
MDKIKIADIDLYYKLCSECNEATGTFDWTEFYTKEGLKEVEKWSWKKFKMIPSGNFVPNFIKRFTLDFWITESNHLTKKELKEILEKNVELIKRFQELQRKEFI